MNTTDIVNSKPALHWVTLTLMFCRVRRRGADMMTFGVAITVLIWLAVAGWFVVLYFDD